MFHKLIWDRLCLKYQEAHAQEILDLVGPTRTDYSDADCEMFLAAEEIAGKLRSANIEFFSDEFFDSSFLNWLFNFAVTNPLPSHYYCATCHRLEWADPHIDGFELPPRLCQCGGILKGDGHNCSPEYFFVAKKVLNPIRFVVWADTLPHCFTLAPEKWFIAAEADCSYGSPNFLRSVSAKQQSVYSYINLPFAFGLRHFGFTQLITDGLSSTFFSSRFNDICIFREDLYRFFVDTLHMEPARAVFYVEKIRKGRSGDCISDLSPLLQAWQSRYIFSIFYLPSKAGVVEDYIRMRSSYPRGYS